MKRIHSWSDVKCDKFSTLVSFFAADVVVIDNVSDFPTTAIYNPIVTIKWKLVPERKKEIFSIRIKINCGNKMISFT